MSAPARVASILIADLRQRSRSPRFWLVLALILVGAAFCFPTVESGYLIVASHGARGYYSSAWVGLSLALMFANFIGLIGFYVVRGTLTRDFETRIWQLLVATPMTRAGYLLAKWLSHLVVFACMVIPALLVGLAAQMVRAENTSIDLIELFKPALVLTLPALAVTAMFAIWFDLLPWLRRTLGNVIYFVLWMVMLVSSVIPLEEAGPEQLQNWRSDSGGMVMVARDLYQARPVSEGEKPSFNFSLGSDKPKNGVTRFEWNAWQPRPQDLAGRALWLLFAVLGVLAAAPLLDWAAARSEAAAAKRNAGDGRRLRWLDRLLSPIERGAFGILVAAELKLALRQRKLWWWAALIALWGVQAFAPHDALKVALCLAWLLPLDIWSRSALREQQTHTSELIFSAPSMKHRLPMVRITVGLLMAAMILWPALLRLSFTLPIQAAALAVVALSLVVWGIALALIARNPRPFELLTVLGVYLGLNGLSVLDALSVPLITAQWHVVALLPAALAVAYLWPRQATARMSG